MTRCIIIDITFKTIALLFIFSQFSLAQFQQIGGASNFSWRTQNNPPVNSIGIGQFPNGTVLPAVLTIDGSLLPTNTGDVFRTNAPIWASTSWRMHRGGVLGNTYEMGRIFNLAGDIHFRVQAMQTNSAIVLHNRVGIGGFANNATIPSVLTVNGSLVPNTTGEVFRTISPATESTFWKMFRGGNEMGRIYNNFDVNFNDIDFRIESVQNNSDIVFHNNYTPNPLQSAGGTERMRIGHRSNVFSGVAISQTSVTISQRPDIPILEGKSLLHIGYSTISGGGGWRSWMDVGTFSVNGSDNMYVGMKDEEIDLVGAGTNTQSAIINWGDNSAAPLGQGDRLRFVFTTPLGVGNVASNDNEGLEIARMVSNGNNGRMGIGNFFTPNVDPQNTLEIRSNTDPLAGDTRSGLRFTNLTSAMPVDVAITNNKVLSVNGTGDVILVDDRGGINECASATQLTGNSGILHNGSSFYFDAQNANENLGVGLACGTALTAKFNVGGNAVIGNNYIGFTAVPANGLLVEGFTGIGTGFTSANLPARQLDVISNTGPQLRLTHSFSNNPLFPTRFTDFQTTAAGNLRINPSDGFLGQNPRVGINLLPGQEPQNTLEIRSGQNGARSGLRLSRLLSGSALAINPGTGVLTVDQDGDVIYVEDKTGIQGCNNLLTGDAGIQLNGNNFYFDAQVASPTDKVGIGMPCGNTLNAKLQVENIVNNDISTTGVAGAFINTGNNVNSAAINFGVIALSATSSVSGGVDNVGGNFLATGSPSQNVGLRAQGTGGADALGGIFEATGAAKNTGIYATVATISGGFPNDVAGLFNGDIATTAGSLISSDKNLKENFAVIPNALDLLSQVKPLTFKFKTTPYLALPDGTQFGVVAQDLQTVLPELVSDITFPEVIDNQGNSLHPAQTWKAVNYTGLLPITIQAVKDLDTKVNNATLSDTQLKQNVLPLQNSLSLINQLNGVSYDWNQLIDTTLELPSGTEIGLIAQAVEAVIPEVIYTDNKGYKHVEYQKIVPILIEANKELQDSLTNLQNQLAALAQQVAIIQNCMDNLPIGAGCGGGHAKTVSPTNNNNVTDVKESQKVTLESSDMAILYQNEPNPFSNTTTIRYYLPNDVNEAVMVFYDEYGREINREILASKGYAQISVESEKLAAGIYTYSIVIDGKVLDTKKMVKVRN